MKYDGDDDDEIPWEELQDGIDYLDGCPHCEQVKAGRLDVTPRYYSTLDYGFVHTFVGPTPHTAVTVVCEVEVPKL